MIQLGLNLFTVFQQFQSSLVECSMEHGKELEGLGREDVLTALGDRGSEVDTLREGHCTVISPVQVLITD